MPRKTRLERFAGKTAIVTGAGAGIGRALARTLASAGALVTVTDRDTQRAVRVTEEIHAAGGMATARTMDVTHPDQIQSVIDSVIAAHGRLDVMLNNAGIAVMGEIRDTPLPLLREMVEVNYMGVVQGSKLAYETMLRQGHGQIINVASTTGLYTYPIFGGYSATKFGVIGFSNALRCEAADLGIRVNVICPQNIRSDIENVIRVLGVEDPGFFKKIPGKWTDANLAAEQMLHGAARNRALIIVPASASPLWWLYRLQPGLIEQVGRYGTRLFRKHRTGPVEGLAARRVEPSGDGHGEPSSERSLN